MYAAEAALIYVAAVVDVDADAVFNIVAVAVFNVAAVTLIKVAKNDRLSTLVGFIKEILKTLFLKVELDFDL